MVDWEGLGGFHPDALSSGNTGEPLSLLQSPGVRVYFSISPSRVGEAAKNRKNWLPTGRERKKGG